MIKLSDIQQNTPQWYASRAGIPTASCFEKIIGKSGKESTQAEGYINKLIGEKMLGTSDTGGYQNAAMQRGHELEPEAREHFQQVTGYEVEQVGLCLTDDGAASCSPDGLLAGKKEGLEIKCPEIQTHVGYLRAGKLPTKYFGQVHGSMWVCGYERWWFMSYYPSLPELLIRVERDDTWCMKLAAALHRFNAELDAACGDLLGQ